MKILFLTTELSAKDGVGKYSLDILNAFSHSVIEPIVITTLGSNNKTDVHTIRLLPPPLSFSKNYLLAPWYAWRIRRFSKEADLIHCLGEQYSCIAYWLSKFLSKPYFITAHGSYSILPYRLPLYRFFHHTSFKGAKSIICVSNYTRKRLSNFILNNLIVIQNGIFFDQFYGDGNLNQDERMDIVLSVGALKPRKGYHISIQAFAKISTQFGSFKYYIVGDQSDEIYYDSLKKLAKDLEVSEKVVFLGSVDEAEKLRLYKSSKIFILTPISEGVYFEGFGLVYLEASACGLPVVGSLDSGAEDAINDQETGFLVSQNNSHIVAEALTKIIENKGLSHEMGLNGIKWSKLHDWKNVIKSYIEVYRTALKE